MPIVSELRSVSKIVKPHGGPRLQVLQQIDVVAHVSFAAFTNALEELIWGKPHISRRFNRNSSPPRSFPVALTFLATRNDLLGAGPTVAAKPSGPCQVPGATEVM
eukprot:5308916-Pyramimonas_sp.AAC.1